VAAASAAVASAAWAVRGRSSTIFADSIWRGPRDRRAIALTFDDGPSESTPEILSLLEKHRVPATFFQVGANVDRLPSISQAVAAAGHEIGNHSYSHPLFCFRRQSFMAAELRRAQETIEARTGAGPRWFRAPFGVRWPGLGAAQRRWGLTGVMWTVIGYDWKLEENAVAGRISGRVGNGAILCLHDGRELHARPDVTSTVKAVGLLVPRLLDQGYKFETVSGLLCQTS